MMKCIIVILSALLFAKGQKANLNVRLIGNIRPDTEPKSAAIFFNNKSQNICSGALIHPIWTITSATCAKKAFNEEMRVKIGGNVNLNFNEASHINNVFLHPNFYELKLENDIALVELVTPTNQINRILKISTEWIRNGEKAYTLGYGDNGDKASNGMLRQQRVSIIDNNICSFYSAVNIDINRLCSYQSKACEGDQGGPLISERSNKLIGIISINPDQVSMCGGAVVSPITTYTRVSVYVHWIRDSTKINHL